MKVITVIMPAYMEAQNIKAAVENTAWAVRNAGIEQYEIIIIDCARPDGSHDGTPDIATDLARTDSHVRVIHNSYINLGQKFWLGVESAKFPYVTMVPGDNELARESIRELLKHIGEADIICSYSVNSEVRPISRRVISKAFTLLINLIADLKLRYYNGMCIHQTALLKQIGERNESFAYMAEILVTLIKHGYSYKEVPFRLQKRAGKSAAFKRDNIVSVVKTVLKLLFRHRFHLNWYRT